MGAVSDVLSSPGHPEVVERILELLDHRSILRAGATCVNINDVVIGSSRLQYILRQALYALPSTYAQFAPRIPTGTLVDRLTDTQRRWDRLEPKRVDIVEHEAEMFKAIATQGVLVVAHYIERDKPWHEDYATSEDDDDHDGPEGWDEDMDSADSDEDDGDIGSVDGEVPTIDVNDIGVPMDDGAEDWETDDSVQGVDDDDLDDMMFGNGGWSTGSDDDDSDDGDDDDDDDDEIAPSKSWTVYDVGLLREADPAVKFKDAVPHWTFKTDKPFKKIAASRNGNVVAVSTLDIEDTLDDQEQPTGARIISTIYFYVLVPDTPGGSSEPVDAIPHPVNDMIQWITYSKTPISTAWAAHPYWFELSFGKNNTIAATFMREASRIKVWRWTTGELLSETDVGIQDRTIGEVAYIPDGDDLLLLHKRELNSSQVAAAAQSAAAAAEPPKPAKTTRQRQEDPHLANVDTDDWEDETDEEVQDDDDDMDDVNDDDDVLQGLQLVLYTSAGSVGVEHEGKGTELLGKSLLKQIGGSAAPIHAVGEITFPVEAREFERPGPESEHDDLFSNDRFSGYEVPYIDTDVDFAIDDSDRRLLCISAQNVDELMAYVGTIRYDELRQRIAAATTPLSIKDWADLVHWDEWLWSEVYVATTGLRVASTRLFEARRRSDVRAQDRVTLRIDDVRGAASLGVGVHPSPLGSRFAPPPESPQTLTTSPQSTTLEMGGEARVALSPGWDVSRPAGETFEMTLLRDPSKAEFREAEISFAGQFGDRFLFGEFEATHLARKSMSAEFVFSKHLGEVVGVSMDADHMYLDMQQRVVVLSF